MAATSPAIRHGGLTAPAALSAALRYCRRNPQLVAGAALLLVLLLICVAGRAFVNVANAQAASVIPNQPPSREFPFGTDGQGKDLFAAMVVGLPLTLWVGFVAGAVGLGVGCVLGFLAGYRGGAVDAVIRMVVDCFLTVPGLLVLVTIAASIKGFISTNVMALVIASLAWMHPTRTIRAQVLTLRERPYLQVARFSGVGTLEIVFREMMPNMLAYIAASFVGAVSAAVLATVGLEALGLGPQNSTDVGMTIYWAIHYNALLRGLWWWWVPPIVVVVDLFLGLYLVAAGLDEIANPRRRASA